MAARNNRKRKRRRNKGRFGFLFKFLCFLTLLTALTVGATVFFRVEVITVSGSSRYTEEEIIAATGIQMGDNLYQLNKNRLSKQVLQQLPYTKTVTIRRNLPNAITIVVTEWEAVAQVLPGTQTPTVEEGETPVEIATEPWLISVGGKLLEPAPAGSSVMTISGLTPLLPQAGDKLSVVDSEATQLSALMDLLEELETLEQLDRVSSIEMGTTQIKLRYLNRFDVKMPLNGDFHYHLRVLDESVKKINAEHGEQSTGTLDLTQKDIPLIYSASG
jgi:cell division protein FtsQ